MKNVTQFIHDFMFEIDSLKKELLTFYNLHL